MLGGSQTTAAKALGITYQAVRKWPENLTPDIENRLIGMLVRGRRKVPDWLIATKPMKAVARIVEPIHLGKLTAECDSAQTQRNNG